MNYIRIALVPVFTVLTVFALQMTPDSLSAASPTSRPATMVKIENFAFEPKDLTVSAGTTVTWQNADDVPHTATSKDDAHTIDSSPLDTDDKYSVTFTKPGIYTYYCKVHPHMTGSITVK